MTSPGRRRLGEAIPVVVWVLLSARLLVFTEEYAATVLVQDQWDFLAGSFAGEGAFERFRHQHGPHRQGLGGVLLAPLLAATHWDGVAIARAGALGLVLAAAVALVLARRLRGELDVWDTAIPVLLLGLGQYQTLVGVPNPAHSALPLLLVVSCAVVLTLESWRTRLTALVVIDGLAVYTGFGLFLGVVIPALLAFELTRLPGDAEGRTPLAFALALSLLVSGSFFLGWDAAKATGGCDAGEIAAGALRWGLPFGRVIGTGHGGLGQGVSLLVLVGVASVLGASLWRAPLAEGRPAGGELVVATLAGFSLLFVATVVAGRSCLEERALYASRYATLAAPGLLALFLASRWAGALPWLPALLCLAVLGAEVRPKPEDLQAVETTLRRRVAFSVCLVDGGELASCQRELGWPPHPDPARAGVAAKLTQLRAAERNVFGDPGRSRVERRAAR